MNNKLKTEQDTPAMAKRVEKAARKYFGARSAWVNFEHGQWWVTLENSAQYSVCDCEGGDSVDGFCFEQVTEADED